MKAVVGSKLSNNRIYIAVKFKKDPNNTHD